VGKPLMDNSWIKLYRKINNNPIMGDTYACHILLWILTNVDKETGIMTTGRKKAAKILNIPETSFYDALKRLQNKYKIIVLNADTSTDTKGRHKGYTTISVLKWAKYQSQNSTPTQEADEKPTLYKKENIYSSNTKHLSNTSIKGESYRKNSKIYIFKGQEYNLDEYHVFQLTNPSCTLPPVKRGSKMQAYAEALTPEQQWEFAEMFGGRS
jgi:hypothetical protein